MDKKDLKMRLFKIATENDKPSNTKQETEVVIYAKVTNPEGLSQAFSVEQHEQAQIKSAKGSVRIRKIIVDGKEPRFEMTSKQKSTDSNVQSSLETTERINESVYNLFMLTCETFMSKTRYIFKAETIKGKKGEMEFEIKAKNINFEVDVFRRPDGKTSQWCKIDLEIDKLKETLTTNDIDVKDIKLVARIGQLPFKPNNIVLDDGSEAEPEKRELITALYSSEFLIPR